MTNKYKNFKFENKFEINYLIVLNIPDITVILFLILWGRKEYTMLGIQQKYNVLSELKK